MQALRSAMRAICVWVIQFHQQYWPWQLTIFVLASWLGA
jgi:hypothetical protein